MVNMHIGHTHKSSLPLSVDHGQIPTRLWVQAERENVVQKWGPWTDIWTTSSCNLVVPSGPTQARSCYIQLLFDDGTLLLMSIFK